MESLLTPEAALAQPQGRGQPSLGHTVPRSKVAYVTVSKYMGQQGAGARDIANLQCFLMSLQKIFGPLLCADGNRTILTVTFMVLTENSTAAIKLRDIFDFEHFNTISKETGRTEMVEYNEFVQKCPSYTLLINFDEKPEMNETVLWQSDTVNGIPECLGRDKLHELDSSFTRHNSQNICVVRAVSFTREYTGESQYYPGQHIPRVVTTECYTYVQQMGGTHTSGVRALW